MKITSLQFFDYRVFYAAAESEKGNYIINVDGKNLLIYGENGSGKSSIFKGLSDFINQRDFIAHYKSDLLNAGFIEVKFDDGTTDRFEASGLKASKVEMLNVARLNSFLSYKELLRTHLVVIDEINFFDLLIDNLLSDYSLSSLGNLKAAWQTIKDKNYNSEVVSITTSLEKGEISEEEAKEQKEILESDYTKDYSKFSDELAQLLQAINENLSKILSYFKQNIEVDLEHIPITIANIQNPKIIANVKYGGKKIPSHQEFLNEARLSAIALSIYLAALKSNPTQNAIEFIFLDDVFVGLDLSNRLPMLEILNKEFTSWQVFFTTYDRHWFELAQRFFNSHVPDKWKSIELYATPETKDAITFEKPVLLPYEENYDKGVIYLHHKTKPDYPASANYFRKAAEEILKSNIPPHEIRDENYALIESFRLGNLVNAGLHFLDKIGATPDLLLQLQNSLPTLLHPLSHYDLSAQVYKGELEELEKLLPLVQKQLIDLKDSYRIFIPEGRMFKLNFNIAANSTGHYEIITRETIYLLREAEGLLSLSKGNCHCKTCYIITGGIETSRRNFNNNDPIAQYTSITNSYDTIYNHIHGLAAYSHIPRAGNPLTEFEYWDGTATYSIEQFKPVVIW